MRCFAHGLLFSACVLGSGARSQQVRLEEADQKLRYELNEQGLMTVSPPPGRGAQLDEKFEFSLNADLEWYAPMDFVAALAFLLPGAEDFASSTDVEFLFGAPGEPTDVDLLRMIGRDAEFGRDAPRDLLRRLAIRRCQQRGFLPAVGLLRRIVRDPEESESLRRAAAEAIADLRGGDASKGDEVALPPLDEVLARAPRRSSALFVVDQRRIPSGRELHRLGRRLRVRDYCLGAAFGAESVDITEWVEAHVTAEFGGLLPYLFTRAFGDHRVVRSVLALSDRLRSESRSLPRVWLHLDGEFDVDAVAAGLERYGFPRERQGEELRARLPFGHLQLTATTAELSIGVNPRATRIGPEAAAALLGKRRVDAAIVAIRGLRAPAGAAEWWTLVPERIEITPPPRYLGAESEWLLTLHFTDGELAANFVAERDSFRAEIEGVAGPLLRAFDVRTAGSTAHVRVGLDDLVDDDVPRGMWSLIRRW